MSADHSEARERARYVKKAIPVDAVQFAEDGSNWAWVHRFMGKVPPLNVPTFYIEIATLEGSIMAKRGDWIVQGVKGEFYPIRKDIFEETYELESKSGRSLEQERLPKIPDPALIDSMSLRYNHGFGLLSANHQEGIRRTMRQLYEEVAGYGFYYPGYKLPVHKGDS